MPELFRRLTVVGLSRAMSAEHIGASARERPHLSSRGEKLADESRWANHRHGGGESSAVGGDIEGCGREPIAVPVPWNSPPEGRV